MMWICLILIVLLYVWFDTDAIPEYFGWTSLAKDYWREKKENPMATDFCTYLLFKYNSSFFIRLITCPLCIGLWAGVLATILSGDWRMVGVNIIAVWLGYSGLRWLIKVFNG